MCHEVSGMSVIPADCIAKLAEALGGKVTKAQLNDIKNDVEKLARQSKVDGVPDADVLPEASRRYARDAKTALVIEKRNALINLNRFQQNLGYVRSVWADKGAEGMRALLTGSIEGRKGARASVARGQRELLGQYYGQVTTELERLELMPEFKSGELDLPIARALWQLNLDTPNLAGIPKDAQAIAKILHKAQEVARADANKAGAWIGKQQGYITRQSHDPWKITTKGLKAWTEAIAPRLDWGRMEAQHGEIKDRGAWLAKTYKNLASGLHLKADGATNATGFKGPGNLAKRMSQERVLHFKSADDWHAYNQEFGTGNLREAVFHGLRSSAQNTGLMRVLGPNPEAMYNRLVDALLNDLDKAGDEKAIKMFRTATAEGGWLANRMDEITGKSNQAVSQIWARRSANIRAVQSMAKLGGSVISSISDLATYGSEMSFQGRGFLSGMGEALASVAQGRPTGERKEILSSLGVLMESIIGDISRTGSLDESIGGGLSRLQQQYFKWNLLTPWTETLRSSAALSMSHHLALQAEKSFDQLAPELKHTLRLFNVTEKDWDHMRANGVKVDSTGTAFMVPDKLDPTQAQQLRQYITDRAETAVLEPDADARAMMRQGTRPGTVIGELMRFVGQFKGFTTSFTRQVLGREVYGRGKDAMADGAIRGLSQLIVASTILGYAAMSAKDAAKGKWPPRDPTDPKTIAKAFTQGGGAGIYGDFLFGEYNRFGQSPLETLAGPTLGTAADATRLWARMVRGDADAGDAMRLALNNTPFMNLFYTRIALDYLILYDMQEAFAPGTLRRMERRAERETGQTFLLSPSRDRAKPFTQ